MVSGVGRKTASGSQGWRSYGFTMVWGECVGSEVGK